MLDLPSKDAVETKKRIEKITAFPLIRLMNNELKIEKQETTYEITYEKHFSSFEFVSREKIDSNSTELSFPLLPIRQDQIKPLLRDVMDQPTFLLKVSDGGYLYCHIPEGVNLSTNLVKGFQHLCGKPRFICSRLMATSNENGGCEKVVNYSKNIEDYPWITFGYEVFGSMHNCMIVHRCEHYRPSPPRKASRY